MRSAGCACRDLVPPERGKSVAAPARSRVTRGLRLLRLSYESQACGRVPAMRAGCYALAALARPSTKKVVMIPSARVTSASRRSSGGAE